MEHEEEHPFYGHHIIRRTEKEKVEALLAKFKGEKPSEELQKKIWDELQRAKHAGEITMPFKVVMRRDARHKYPDSVEIILDTKV